MKKIFLSFTLFATGLWCSAQDVPSDTKPLVLTKDDYLAKSKAQRTGAIILISAGGAAAIAGVAIATNDLGDDLGGLFDPNYEDTDSDETVSGILFFGGVAAMLGSIPLFVSAHKNKKRAMALSFKNIPSHQIYNNMVVHRFIPSVNLRISL